MKKLSTPASVRNIRQILWLMLALIGMATGFASCDKTEASELEESIGKKPVDEQTGTKSDLLSQKDLNEAMRAYFPHRNFVDQEYVPSEDNPTITIDDNDYCFLPLDATIDDAANIFYDGIGISNAVLFNLKGDDFDWSAWLTTVQDYAYPVAAKGATLYLNSPKMPLYTIQILCDHDGIISDISQVSSRKISVCHTSAPFNSTHRIEFGSNDTDSPKIWIIVMKLVSSSSQDGIMDDEGNLEFGTNLIFRFAQMPSDPNYEFRVKDYYLSNPYMYYERYIDWDRQYDWMFNMDDEYPSIH